jgi:hypothetical protein
MLEEIRNLISPDEAFERAVSNAALDPVRSTQFDGPPRVNQYWAGYYMGLMDDSISRDPKLYRATDEEMWLKGFDDARGDKELDQ